MKLGISNHSNPYGEELGAQRLSDGKPADEVQIGGDHYKQMPVQPWDVMQAILSPEEFKGYLKGNLIRYAMRAGHKGGAQGMEEDIGKFYHYSQKLSEVVQQYEIDRIVNEEEL